MTQVAKPGAWTRVKARMLRKMSIGGGEALHHARLMILPTPFGLFWAVLVILLLLLGINYENSLAHGLSFWLFAVAVVSIFRSWRNLAGVRVQLIADGEAFAGNTLRVMVRLTGRARSHAIDVRLGEARQRLEIHDGEGSAPLELAAFQRGQFSLPTLTLESRWPLGLVRLWAWVAIDTPVLVYPQPELPSTPQGSRRTLEQIEQGDFAGLRRYVPVMRQRISPGSTGGAAASWSPSASRRLRVPRCGWITRPVVATWSSGSRSSRRACWRRKAPRRPMVCGCRARHWPSPAAGRIVVECLRR